jgi:hypothetical protein
MCNFTTQLCVLSNNIFVSHLALELPCNFLFKASEVIVFK